MPSQATCPHCRAPLSEHARRTGAAHCGAARCRRAADGARRKALAGQLLDGLTLQSPPLVVWLQPYAPVFTAVQASDRARHRAHLDRLLAERDAIDPDRLAAPSSGSHPHEARLCGDCGGRCCTHGAAWHAFIDWPLLQRWQAAHPGGSETDAAEAYLARLPDEHAEHSCLYHTRQGCALPRAMRADICNGYACDALQQLQQAGDAERGEPVLAMATGEQGQLLRATLLAEHGSRPLLPRADAGT